MTQHTNWFSQQQAMPQAWTGEQQSSAGTTGMEGRQAWGGGGGGEFGTEFNPMGVSCQPCPEGKRHVPVCSAHLCHKAQLYFLWGGRCDVLKGVTEELPAGCSVISLDKTTSVN